MRRTIVGALVVLVSFVVAPGLAAFAQTQDLSTASLSGTWRLSVVVDSYTNDFFGAEPATNTPPPGSIAVGSRTDELVVFSTTCTSPGQCALTIADTNGTQGVRGASGFVGPLPSSLPEVQDGASVHSGFFSGGFAGQGNFDCDPANPSPSFPVDLKLTITGAAPGPNGLNATALTGSEIVIVPVCPTGRTQVLYRRMTISTGVRVDLPTATTTSTPSSPASGGTAAGATPAAVRKVVDVKNGPAPVATALPSPADAFVSPGRIAANALIAAAAVFLIVFPSQLFNKTYEENHDEIVAGWERRLRWLRERRARQTDEDQERRRLRVFLAVLLIGSLLGGLLNPAFGLNVSSAASLLATLVAFAIGAAVSAAIAIAYRRAKRREHRPYPQAIPSGLVIAAVCVALSRLCNFEPGYLYGLICGVGFSTAIERNEEAHVVALDSLGTLVIAVVAWLVWIPVNHAALHVHPAFPIVLLDDVLGSVFVAGLVGTVLGLFPLRFMPGYKLATWHRGAWAAVFFVAVFGLVQVMLRPESGLGHPGTAPLGTVIVLFVAFGAASVGFALYWARRKRDRLVDALAAVTVRVADPPAPDPEADA